MKKQYLSLFLELVFISIFYLPFISVSGLGEMSLAYNDIYLAFIVPLIYLIIIITLEIVKKAKTQRNIDYIVVGIMSIFTLIVFLSAIRRIDYSNSSLFTTISYAPFVGMVIVFLYFMLVIKSKSLDTHSKVLEKSDNKVINKVSYQSETRMVEKPLEETKVNVKEDMIIASVNNKTTITDHKDKTITKVNVEVNDVKNKQVKPKVKSDYEKLLDKFAANEISYKEFKKEKAKLLEKK